MNPQLTARMLRRQMPTGQVQVPGINAQMQGDPKAAMAAMQQRKNQRPPAPSLDPTGMTAPPGAPPQGIVPGRQSKMANAGRIPGQAMGIARKGQPQPPMTGGEYSAQ